MFGTLFLLATSSMGGVGTDLMTEIRTGKMLCSNPDLGKKTCSAITIFSVGQDGSVKETTEMLIAPNPPITVEMSAPSQIQGPVNCTVLTIPQMQKGKVRINGAPLPSDQNLAVLSKIMEVMGPMADKRACDEIRIEAGQLVKFGQVEGVEVKLPGKPVRWISMDEGFKVAPR